MVTDVHFTVASKIGPKLDVNIGENWRKETLSDTVSNRQFQQVSFSFFLLLVCTMSVLKSRCNTLTMLKCHLIKNYIKSGFRPIFCSITVFFTFSHYLLKLTVTLTVSDGVSSLQFWPIKTSNFGLILVKIGEKKHRQIPSITVSFGK